MTATLRERLQGDLLAGLKARDTARVALLRSTLAAIDNAAAVPVPQRSGSAAPRRFGATEVPRRSLTEDDVRAVVAAERAELLEVAAAFRHRGHLEPAAALNAQAALLGDYLAAPA